MVEEEIREFYNNQNRFISLNPSRDQAEYYAPILSFFQRCRIHYALTHSPKISLTYLQQFWATAAYDTREEPPFMRATVNNQEIQFSADTIRQALRLGTIAQEDGPVIFPAEFRRGAFTRMGYSGDVNNDHMSKSYVYGQWRLLMHVIIDAKILHLQGS